jgi:lauroyl/myristoyl acyltransferase
VLKYYVFRLAGVLVPRVPQRLGYGLAGLLAWAISILPLPANRVLRANLRQALGPGFDEREVRRLARAALRNNVVNYYELFLLPSISPEEVAQRTSIQGLERGERALAMGKGLIITMPHFGNFNLASQLTRYYQVPVTMVVEDLEPPEFYDYVTRLRTTHGIKAVPASQSLRPVVRALHANEAVGLAADRDVTGGGERLPFFGAPARIPVGHVKLALRTGAPILPCFVVRESNDHSRVYVEEPLFLTPGEDSRRDVREGTQRIIALMERYIRAYPDQWLAFQPIWDGNGPESAAAEE